MEKNIWNFDYSSTFPGVPRCPTKNLGPIGSAVLTFIGYKQTDRQAKFIYRWSQFFTDWFLLKKFKPSYMNWTQKTMNEKLNFNVFFFKNGFFFENCADCTDFLKKCTDL